MVDNYYFNFKMEKKNKLNQILLNEELKRFKLLSEYTFITTEEPIMGYEKNKSVILGDSSIDEAEEDENLNADDSNQDGTDIPVDAADVPTEEPTEEPVDDTEIPTDDAELPVDDAELPVGDEEMPTDVAGDEVEIDVTSIVKGTEEAKAAAEAANSNAEILLQKLQDLEDRISSMSDINTKIDTLEKELIKRNPTPNEKQSLISLSSFPYNQTLSDYWGDKEERDEKEKEYVLTQNDVDEYSDEEIKNSFNDYEEEDI